MSAWPEALPTEVCRWLVAHRSKRQYGQAISQTHRIAQHSLDGLVLTKLVGKVILRFIQLNLETLQQRTPLIFTRLMLGLLRHSQFCFIVCSPGMVLRCNQVIVKFINKLCQLWILFLIFYALLPPLQRPTDASSSLPISTHLCVACSASRHQAHAVVAQ